MAWDGQWAEACNKALKLLGVKRLGVLTPYWPATSAHVVQFFTEAGFEVVAQKDLQCPTPVSIAHVTVDECREALLAVNSPEVEAIVQCGTDLNMVRLADEAEPGWASRLFRSTPPFGGWPSGTTIFRTSCMASERCSGSSDAPGVLTWNLGYGLLLVHFDISTTRPVKAGRLPWTW